MIALQRVSFAVLVAAAFAFAGPQPAGPEPAAGTVAVLKSRSAGPYEAALEGFRAHLREQDPTLETEIYDLDNEAGRVESALRSFRQQPPELVFSLGAMATRKATGALSEVPIVAALVLDAQAFDGSRNATGVMLEFPVEVQLSWLKRFLPRRRSVGVLFDPATNREKIDAAASQARKEGLKLVSREIHSPREIPDALKGLSRNVDVLWGITDPTVLSPETAKTLLLFSYRNRIPLAGLSDSWVKAGALYALERDYEDIGRQSAEIALRILSGTPPSALPPSAPRKVLYSLNLKAARHLKLTLPAALIDGASTAYE